MNEAELNERLGALGRSLAMELVHNGDTRVFETVLGHFRRAGLEPVMKVEVVTPQEYLGDVIGDLNSRGGQVQGHDTRGNAMSVDAFVPLANMFSYVTELRSFTQGRAHGMIQFSHYDEVSGGGDPPDGEPAAAALRA